MHIEPNLSPGLNPDRSSRSPASQFRQDLSDHPQSAPHHRHRPPETLGSIPEPKIPEQAPAKRNEPSHRTGSGRQSHNDSQDGRQENRPGTKIFTRVHSIDQQQGRRDLQAE